MGNVILLITCFVIGILLRRSRRLPENAHAALERVRHPRLAARADPGLRP